MIPNKKLYEVFATFNISQASQYPIFIIYYNESCQICSADILLKLKNVWTNHSYSNNELEEFI